MQCNAPHSRNVDCDSRESRRIFSSAQHQGIKAGQFLFMNRKSILSIDAFFGLCAIVIRFKTPPKQIFLI